MGHLLSILSSTGGLIQRAAIMQLKGRSLSSSIALRVSFSSMAVLVGTNSMMMLYVLLLIVRSPPDAVASFLQFIPIFSHCAASLLESSSRVPPLWSTVRDFRLRSGVVSSAMLVSLVWNIVISSFCVHICFDTR